MPFSYCTETWFSVLVDHRDLRLRVGPEPIGFAALANPRQLAAEPMGEHDRSRHQFRSIIAGETEHQALVARALLGGFLAGGGARVDALGDVRALGRDDVHDEHAIGVEYVIVVGVADVADGLAHDLIVGGHGLGGDFATDHDDVALGVGLASDPAGGILGQARVEHGVGNGVADFVGMAFADRLRRKDVISAHPV